MHATAYDTLIAFLDAPMTEWDARQAATPAADRYDLEEAAAALATRAARLSAYLSARKRAPHVRAVAEQNRAARRVRQALGYTYADDSITF